MKKSVLIIGANSDIAKQIGKNYLNDKNFLHLFTRNIEELSKFEQGLFLNENVKIRKFDLTEHINFKEIVNSLNPRPEIVVIANGYMGSENSDPYDDIIKTVNINFTYLAIISEKVISYFIEKKVQGNLAVISSIAGIRGRAKNYIYGSSKSGISNYLSGLRQKYSNKNFCITTIILGFVNTKMNKENNNNFFLTSKPEDVSKEIIKSITNNKEIYIPFRWRIISFIIQLIPEKIFKKLKF